MNAVTASEQTPPLVSVIIPAFNAEEHIEHAIRSALNQTYDRLEVIVVDDGSRDRTIDVVHSISDDDERVMLLTQRNKGVAAARNAGIEAARGTFIAPLDADDVWYPDKILRQVREFERSDGDVGLVYAWWVALNEQGSVLWPSSKWNIEGNVFEALVVTNFIGNASVPLMRRFCVLESGGYNEDLRARGGQGCEDWDLALRIAERHEFRVVPDYLVGYRRLRESMSSIDSSMSTSYELIIEGIEIEHPEIPASTFRWSRKHFFYWLGARSYLRGDYRTALRWIVKAVYWDPLCLLTKRVLSILAKSAVQAGMLPIISALFRDDQAWTNFKARWRRRRRVTTTMTDIRQDGGHQPFPCTWKPWSLYDRICKRRWHRITRDFSRYDDAFFVHSGMEAGGDGHHVTELVTK